MPNTVTPWYRRLIPLSGGRKLETIVSSPDFYAGELLPAHRPPAISFVEAGLDVYRRSSFLDHRMQRKPRAKKISCGVGQLLEHYEGAPPGRVAFIFHVAFCCSTLLARYLELLPDTFVLKEPFILTQLAELNREGKNREEVMRLCVQLLARTYERSQMAIVKLADQCNALAGALMASASSDTPRAVFIGLELRPFLLAGLKTDQRRSWVRRRAELAARDVAPSPLAETDPKTLDDGRACAYLWLTQGVLLQKLVKDAGPNRVLVVDGEDISDNPEATVREVAAWLGLSPGESDLTAALSDETAGHYSKDPSQTFTREDRQAELAAIYARLGDEVESAMAWAASIAPGLGLNPSSGRMVT